jgi:hypothetical protein
MKDSEFDLDAMIAQSQKALEELIEENERDGTNEYIRQFCEEEQRRWDEYFAEQGELDSPEAPEGIADLPKQRLAESFDASKLETKSS